MDPFVKIDDDGTGTVSYESPLTGEVTIPAKWAAVDAGDNVLAESSNYGTLATRYRAGCQQGKITILPTERN